MSYNQNHLWPENLQFTHEKKGYSPKEVDRAMMAHEKSKAIMTEQIRILHNEINVTKNENAQLKSTLMEYKDKVQRLIVTMNRIEEERARESLRLAEIMTNAGKNADKTLLYAQQKAEQITKDAQKKADQITKDAQIKAEQITKVAQIKAEQITEDAQRKAEEVQRKVEEVQRKTETDTKASRDELHKLAQTVRSAKETHVQHFESLEILLRGTAEEVNIYQQTESTVEYSQSSPQRTPGGYQEQPRVVPEDSLEKDDGEDPYMKWIREQELRSNNSPSPENEQSPDKIIGHFGDE